MCRHNIYFDNSSTTLVHPMAANKAYEMMTHDYGNPSSLHKLGLTAHLAMEEAARQAARVIGAPEECITFTSGGTEGDNLAIIGGAMAKKRRGNRIVTTAFEHDAVLNAFRYLETQGFEAVYIRPDSQGRIDVQEVLGAVDERTVLVSLMAVNNEVGTVLPISRLCRGIRRKNRETLIHCDAVQAYGKMPIRVGGSFDVDLLTFSGHKIHGPKGVGGLYIRKGVRILPILYGGGQQNGLRPGTENVPLACAMGVACEYAGKGMEEFEEHVRMLWNRLEKRLKNCPGVRINSPSDATPYIMNFSVPGIRSEVMLHFMEEQGIYLSSGSACAKGQRSHVLKAMGLPDPVIDSALRVSFSYINAPEEVDSFMEVLEEGMATLRR